MDKEKLRKRILTDWMAIDKLLFENRKPNRFSKVYPKYIAAKGQLVREAYRLRKLMGQPEEVIFETYHDVPAREAQEMVKTSEEIVVKLGSNNSRLAESLVLSKERDIRNARLEALLLGEALLDESAVQKLSKTVGSEIKKQVFEALVETVVELASKC